MTAAEILKKYPRLKFYIGDITDYEYAYIHEQDIRLVFLTNDTNRVGKYLKKDWEKGSVGISRPAGRIDRIDF